MFIYNGKSLFGNAGLIISLIILVILLYFSYKKCYINDIDTFEGESEDTQSNDDSTLIPPSNVRITINGSSIIVKFTVDNSSTDVLPKSFIIVLAQYNSDKINTGNNKFYLSNETIFNPNLKNISNPTSLNLSNSTIENICNIVDSFPVCQYAFKNIDIKDNYGNLYYYKIGISAIYPNGNSKYVTPYNINSANKMFSLTNTIDKQNIENTNLQECVQSKNNNSAISSTYNDTILTADGQYELIKSQLGNYPDNLFLESEKINKGSLADLVDKSMAQALLNVNVSVQ